MGEREEHSNSGCWCLFIVLEETSTSFTVGSIAAYTLTIVMMSEVNVVPNCAIWQKKAADGNEVKSLVWLRVCGTAPPPEPSTSHASRARI